MAEHKSPKTDALRAMREARHAGREKPVTAKKPPSDVTKTTSKKKP